MSWHGKVKNGKAAGKDEITGEMIKGGGDRMVDWIWRVCNMTFESSVVVEIWRSLVILPLYKGKGERTESKNYRGISLLNFGSKNILLLLLFGEHLAAGSTPGAISLRKTKTY